jgi:hypothetical protein
MHPPETGKAPPIPTGSASQKGDEWPAGPLNQNHSDAAPAYQACSKLELQIFCLTRRFALTAPMAASLAPLIWSWRS